MLDTERVALAACLQAAHTVGYDVPDELYRSTVGRDEKDTRRILIEHYGDQFPYDAFHLRWRQCRKTILEREGVGTKPGLLNLLTYADQKKIRIAVATSSARAQTLQLLTSAKLMGRLHALVCGDEIKKGKPFPDIFLRAAETLQERPADCLVLEDSNPGILAAHAAGMRAILVPDLQSASQEVSQNAWTICTSLYDVREFLEGQDC